VLYEQSHRQIFHDVRLLDDDQIFDIDAFFQGSNPGVISTLKPADLAQYTGETLRGFSADTNLPDAPARCKNGD